MTDETTDEPTPDDDDRDARPDEIRVRVGRKVYRSDGFGDVERVHPTELAMERRDGSDDPSARETW